MSTDIKVLTFNINTDVRQGEANQTQDFMNRARPLSLYINGHYPHVVHLQEVPKAGHDYIKGQFSSLYHVFYGLKTEPYTPGKVKNDGTLTMLRKDRFQISQQNKVVFNDAAAAQNANNSGHFYILSDVVDNITGASLKVFNTHIRGGQPATVGDAEVAQIARDMGNTGFVIGSGDFNATPQGPRMQTLANNRFALDTSTVATHGATTTKLDHVVSRGLSCVTAFTDTNCGLSDHFPLVATLRYNQPPQISTTTTTQSQQPTPSLTTPQQPHRRLPNKMDSGTYRHKVIENFHREFLATHNRTGQARDEVAKAVSTYAHQALNKAANGAQGQFKALAIQHFKKYMTEKLPTKFPSLDTRRDQQQAMAAFNKAF